MPRHDYTKEDLAITDPDGSGGLYMRIVNDLIVNDEELNGIVEFQFPPVVKGDTKSANWQTEDQASFEPVAIFRGSNARKLSLQWEYVVVSRTNSGTLKWTIDRITKSLRNLKSYFYITVQEGIATFPLVQLKLFEYAPLSGDKNSTWRMNSVNITPSGPIISSNGLRLQLKHTVTAELELVTQNNPILSRGADGTDAKNPSQDLPKGSEIKKWF